MYAWKFNEYYVKRYDQTNLIPNNNSLPYRIDLELEKINPLSVNISGKIQEGDFDLVLNLTSKNHFNNLVICIVHSVGIVKVETQERFYYNCLSEWVNWSKCEEKYYEAKTGICHKYIYLEKGFYRCSQDNTIKECEQVEYNKCIFHQNQEVPKRYLGLIDRCFFSERNLFNESVEYKFNFEGRNLLYYDYITFKFIDKDLEYINGNWTLTTGINQDIGLKDQEFTFSNL